MDDRGVELRMGLHTGRPTPTASGYVGIAVNTVARICALADGGDILVSSAARAALEAEGSRVAWTDRGRHRLRGMPDEIALFAARPDRT